MRITYDAAKQAMNLAKHDVSFDDAYVFNFSTSHTVIDARRDYGETRYRAIGWLHGRLHVLVYCETADGVRVISFRKANAREVRRYEKEKAE